MTVSSANYVFLPWVRQGAATGIETEDGLNENQPAVVSVQVKLKVNKEPDIERQVRLYGPGDVTAIDPQQVVRTEPRNLATDFEPNYFPAVEFDRPDFPWLFTPAKANTLGKLRPWLCLVVVRKQDGVTLRVDRTLPLPILEIKTPAQPRNELPDLAESWAWAHTQVTGCRPQDDPLRAALAGDPALTVSRLLCPRRLDPLTEYLACVVPTFDLGSQAGLGKPVARADEGSLKPAWRSGAQSPAQVTLPVYFHWEFRTGAGGDFEALVGLLQPRDTADMPPQVGKRLVDISQPGFQMVKPLPEGTSLEFEGALRLLDAQIAPWPDEQRSVFQAGLKKVLEVPWLAMTSGGLEPLAAPPIYGSWHAARHTVETNPVAPAKPTWLDDLNLDPRNRAVAALGTAVVQNQQEQLMASAWEQLGEIERINQLKRQAQLGRAVNSAYHARHFSRFSEETLLKVVAPAQSRLVVETVSATNQPIRTLLSQKISQSAMPDRTVSAPLRKLTSPRSVISTRFQAFGAPAIAMVAQLNTITSIVTPQRIEAGLVTINQVTDALSVAAAAQFKQVVRFEGISNALQFGPKLRDFTTVKEGSAKRSLLSFTFPAAAADNDPAKLFLQAARDHQSYLAQATAVPSAFTTLKPPPLMDLVTTKELLLRSVDPKKTITARVKASLGPAGASATAADPLEPILDAPDFPQPMYEVLRDLSQDLLFPGLEHVPPNTITLLGTNPKFVESFLVGLNVEMDREFLWRNFPTDQRGTFFQQFWDTSAGSRLRDIEAIHKWETRRLGDNVRKGENLVLLIRGELLRRYPNSVIYAAKAVLENGELVPSKLSQDEFHPLFRGTLKPDVTFLGFGLKREDAIANPGFFFIIQQQPTEPRFGLDVADFVKPLPALTDWNALSWRHLAATPEALNALSHVSTQAAMPDINKAKWGRNSAHQAYITLQRPVRIAIHGKEMLLKG